MRGRLIAVVALGLLAQLASCALFEPKPPNILDAEPLESEEEALRVAGELCRVGQSKTKSRQISRITTVLELARLVDELKPEASQQRNMSPQLYHCLQFYSRSVRELAELLQASYENVCSDAKLQLIEDYHAYYLSTAREDREARAEPDGWQAPQLLKLFFMHYAFEVSAVCRRSFINNLEWDLKEKLSERDYLLDDGRPLDKLSAGLHSYFHDTLVDDYDNIVLVWDLVKAPLLAGEERAEPADEEHYDELTGQAVKLYIKSSDISTARRMQQSCRTKFKPVYEQLIMPIVRLSNLGYANTGSQFERELKELRTNELVRRWFSITQLCEALLPIKFYMDSALAPGDTVVISKEEAQLFDARMAEMRGSLALAASSERPLVYEPSTNSMEGVDKLDSVETSEAQELVKRVRLNVSARERAIKRALLQVTKAIKGPQLIHLFLSHRPKSSAGFVQTDLVASARDSYAGLSDEELLKLEGGGQLRPIERKKRRQRPVDSVAEKEKRSEALTYMHTKTWGQILGEWVEALMPSRGALLFVGLLLCLLPVLVVFLG